MSKREKPDPQDPGPLPAEEKRSRPALPLSDRAAEIIRNTAKYIRADQETVKLSIAMSGVPNDSDGARSLDNFVEVVCRGLAESYDRSRTAERDSIFSKPLDTTAVEEPIREKV